MRLEIGEEWYILFLGHFVPALSVISQRGGNMTRFWLFTSVLLVALLAGCGSSQDAVDLAVCQTQIAVPTNTLAVVTVVETVTVETTREISVTRKVEIEVEVTREVTRLVEVERIVTATSTPTLEPTSTPTPTNTPSQPPPTVPPATTSRTTLLAAMRTTREDIGTCGYLIDEALDRGYIHCQEVVDTYNRVMDAPVFSNLPSDLQPAHSSYRVAIDIVRNEGFDLAGLCQDLVDGKRDQPISSFVWSRARAAVNDALDVLEPAIISLE